MAKGSDIVQTEIQSYLLVLLIVSTFVTSYNGEQVPVAIVRRISGDIIYFGYNSSDSELYFVSCSDSEKTYLITERQCVTNEELFNGSWMILR